jgi:hypothetical protein
MTKLRVALRNFSNTPKNGHANIGNLGNYGNDGNHRTIDGLASKGRCSKHGNTGSHSNSM